MNTRTAYERHNMTPELAAYIATTELPSMVATTKDRIQTMPFDIAGSWVRFDGSIASVVLAHILYCIAPYYDDLYIPCVNETAGNNPFNLVTPVCTVLDPSEVAAGDWDVCITARLDPTGIYAVYSDVPNNDPVAALYYVMPMLDWSEDQCAAYCIKHKLFKDC